jgi:hypothetical protein
MSDDMLWWDLLGDDELIGRLVARGEPEQVARWLVAHRDHDRECQSRQIMAELLA